MNGVGDNESYSLFASFTMNGPNSPKSFKIPSTSIPQRSKELDVEYSNVTELKTHCDTCFPVMSELTPVRGNYVDLLQFSTFNGIPYPIIDPSKKPKRWFADLRYSWSVPLSHEYPSVTKEVLASSRVQHTFTKLLREQPNTTIDQLKSRAIKFFTEIRAKLSKFVCKVCSYILYKVFRRLMSKLLVCPEELERIRKVESNGLPIVYLPLHRSHLDYLLITWCNWHFRLKLPHIASGDNLNLSGLGWLLRATGAFFIRRRVNPNDEGGKDVFYRAILHSYIEQILKKDLPIEFFLEGTRNRFGKVLTPKNGLISNVVQAVQQGIIKDCYLVPVSYTYDAVVEGIFLNELMGIPKVRESVFGVFKGIFDGFSKSKQCGVVRMHYGRPVKLSTYLSAMTASLACRENKPARLTRIPNSFSYRELVPWHRTHSETVDDRSMIRAIGFHVVYEGQMMCSISPIAVVSCLLLTKYRTGVDRGTLEDDCQWLSEEIIKEGGDVVGYKANDTDGSVVLKYSLEKLAECVDYSNEDIIQPIQNHSAFITLAYNKNSVISRFSIKSAIAIGIVCRSSANEHSIEEIVEDTLSICDWMQFEFLFCRPCDSLRELIHDVLGQNEWSHPVRGMLKSDYEDSGFVDAGDMVSESTHVKIRDERSRDIIGFFANFIRPFIQSLYLVANFIASDRCPVEPLSESQLIRILCEESLAKRFDLPFEPLLESINSDSFKNSLRILREKGILNRMEPGTVSQCNSAHMSGLINNLQRILRVQT